MRKLGVLNAGDIQLETEVRNKTLEAMTQEAIEKGLLKAAESNVQTGLQAIIQSL